MMQHSDITAKIRAIQRLLEQKFGVRSRTLAKGLRRAGRRLPKAVHQDGQALIKAEVLVRNPKVRYQLDLAAVEAAFERMQTHLKAIDVTDRRKGTFLKLLGTAVSQFLIIIFLFVIWLWWRGYI